jgi:hypothetical protein
VLLPGRKDWDAVMKVEQLVYMESMIRAPGPADAPLRQARA